ncbi:hypothetical protein NC651_022544 [Populus alba x Populus x berolinensis]|nr:hypothetical protein NC651_022544 [Populus alba x Populus x berolinensis]
MAALAQVSASLSLSIHDVSAVRPSRTRLPISRLPTSSLARNGTAFATVISRTSRQKKAAGRATFVSVRCGKSTQEGSGVDVWIGRLAMVGFAGVVSVEIATGKGLLENFGLTVPLPTVALAVTGLMGSDVDIVENVKVMSIFICSKGFHPRSAVPNAYQRLFYSIPVRRKQMEIEPEPPPLTSYGFNVETVVYKNISFTVWDVGGQQKVHSKLFCHFRTWTTRRSGLAI